MNLQLTQKQYDWIHNNQDIVRAALKTNNIAILKNIENSGDYLDLFGQHQNIEHVLLEYDKIKGK